MRDGDERDRTLTDGEQTVLFAALEGGYFEIPRETTLATIADELDITDRQAAERLRRGMAKVFRKHRSLLEGIPSEEVD